MSDRSISSSGIAASFSSRRFCAAVMGLEENILRTIFPISLSLLSRCLSGGNNADNLVPILFVARVHRQQQDRRSAQAPGSAQAQYPPPYFLAAVILLDNRVRIREHQHGVFKSDSMLAPIAIRLGGIPFKSQHNATNIIP